MSTTELSQPMNFALLFTTEVIPPSR
jgi:hypothetical protein